MSHDDDLRWMREAIALAHQCLPTDSAYAVGAILVGSNGAELSRGYSRETDPSVHAEESALAKLPTPRPDLTGATLYSTLEPCSQRRSRPLTCTQLILNTPITRVVYAWREPPLLADCHGHELLTQAGITVVELPDLADEARVPNRHLFKP
ncbi:dCMP deaminase [Actinokineospora diospyrosa]|uniref:Diaminohydroxyphosphoribosylaminopyrimidine deaminase n=1 Tax=Actinokineospora diospyrosa TaxID=103728 RepID=A0ABT1IJ68_9PSEU|nr:dCMP deaminase [Actinokineospora diospyrosa]MCP2272700.1 diaminohydroxyphosphoribosylaminopyrimidine deaminase [Actinokineospora diospyrosa]